MVVSDFQQEPGGEFVMLQHSAEMMLLFPVEAPWKDQAN